MTEHADVTLVREGYEAFSKGDVGTLTRLIAEDAVQHVGGEHPLAGDYKGREQILAHYGQLAEQSGGSFRVELQQLFTDGHGHVMAVHRVSAERGGQSLAQAGGLFFTVRDGEAVDIVQCDDDQEAINRFWS